MEINSSFHVNNSREDIINDLHSLCKGTFFPRHMSSFSCFFYSRLIRLFVLNCLSLRIILCFIKTDEEVNIFLFTSFVRS